MNQNEKHNLLYALRTHHIAHEISHAMIIPSLIALWYLNYHIIFWIVLALMILGDLVLIFKITKIETKIFGKTL